ncbi:MAG TPA: class I SAM-dependent methyltransferase [Candidatus Binatia bacterium]|nr:class I SAM-dependent methyltransferase [Candidatus Binatia bacterium]
MFSRSVVRSNTTALTLVLALLAAGCTTLKQCAYEGFNRDQWQQPERVIEALQIRPGERIADLGSGSGYFTFRLAKAAGPNGKVYAVDIDRDLNEALAARAKKESFANIEVILAKPDDPLLPSADVDLIFTSNTYHHLQDRVRYFANLKKYLRPGGRIAIIDFNQKAWLEGLLRHYTPSDLIQREMEQAGYVVGREFDFLEKQSFLVFAPRQP